MSTKGTQPVDQQARRQRIAGAVAVAVAYALGCYMLVDWVRPDSGVVSVTFALVQPAAICAFLCYILDPLGCKPRRAYLAVPAVSAVGMIALAALVLQEGVICIVMLTPLWLLSGTAGALMTHALNRGPAKPDYAETFRASALLAIPLVLMPLEAAMPVPEARYTVTRVVVIKAPAEAIWPLMQGIPDVDAHEGRWNVTQDVLGVPRPRSARLEGSGPRSIRHAHWERGIAFQEVVTDWQPHRRIAWRFDFTGSRGWEFTDRHLRPDSTYLRIHEGGYTLQPLPRGRHLLRLETSYIARTHFNGYARVMGELFLGDIEANMLAVIKVRAEE